MSGERIDNVAVLVEEWPRPTTPTAGATADDTRPARACTRACRSASASGLPPGLPDRITLYRQPILAVVPHGSRGARRDPPDGHPRDRRTTSGSTTTSCRDSAGDRRAHRRRDALPGDVRGPLGDSILGRAHRAGRLDVRYVNPRDFTSDRHRTVDDYPYGGGPGMVMKPEPIVPRRRVGAPRPRSSAVVLLSPAGRVFTQAVAAELAEREHLVLICGHYEGVDERVRRAPGDRRALDWRLRADRRRACGDGRDRRGRAAAAGRARARTSRPATSRTATGCWSTRSTPARPSSAAGRCRTCCSRGTTPRSRSGGGGRRWSGRAERRPDLMTPELRTRSLTTGTNRARSVPAAARSPTDPAVPTELPEGRTLSRIV